MLRKGFLAWVAFLLLPVLLSAYTIVLKDGRRIQAKARYVVAGSVVEFVGTDGRAYELGLAEVDLAATQRANPPAKTRPRPTVWTNDDLELLRTRGGVSVVGTPRPAPAPKEAAPEETKGKPAGEEEPKPLPPKEETREYWQERSKSLRDQLAQVEQQLQRLQGGQGLAVSNTIDLMGSNPGVQVADTIRRLERRRAEIQRQIRDLQSEARRKGIPPGWVR